MAYGGIESGAERRRKRSFLEAVSEDEPNLSIITEDCPQGVPAHLEILRLVSSCAKGLPPTDTWDLRSMRVDDARVTQPTLLLWLSMVYSGLAKCAFEPPSTWHELIPLLALCDALGTESGLVGDRLQIALSGDGSGSMRPLMLHVAVEDPPHNLTATANANTANANTANANTANANTANTISNTGSSSVTASGGAASGAGGASAGAVPASSLCLSLRVCPPHMYTLAEGYVLEDGVVGCETVAAMKRANMRMGSEAEMEAFRLRAAECLESSLHSCLRLRAPGLAAHLITFTRLHVHYGDASLLPPRMAMHVFSERVMQAIPREQLYASFLTAQLCLRSGGPAPLLRLDKPFKLKCAWEGRMQTLAALTGGQVPADLKRVKEAGAAADSGGGAGAEAAGSGAAGSSSSMSAVHADGRMRMDACCIEVGGGGKSSGASGSAGSGMPPGRMLLITPVNKSSSSAALAGNHGWAAAAEAGGVHGAVSVRRESAARDGRLEGEVVLCSRAVESGVKMAAAAAARVPAGHAQWL